MENMYNKIMIIIRIIVGIFSGIVIYILIVRPLAVRSCLINSENCSRVTYRKKDNTVLIDDAESGTCIWFVGRDILVYNEPTGRVCENSKEPVYVWDLATNKPRGYLCADALDHVREKYYSNSPIQTLILKTRATFHVIDMVNALIDSNVIQMHAHNVINV